MSRVTSGRGRDEGAIVLLRIALAATFMILAPLGQALAQGFSPLTPGIAPMGVSAEPTPAASAPAVAAAQPAAPAAPAPQLSDGSAIYTDPNGNFRAPIPAGWSANQPGDGSVQITQGPAWVVLATVQPTDPEAGAKVVIDQMSGPYQLVQSNGATAKVSGHPIYYAVFKGQSQQQGPVAMMIAGIQAPSGHVLAFISSAPLDSINSFSPAFLEIMQGVRFAGE
jgi:hypothetical protein